MVNAEILKECYPVKINEYISNPKKIMLRSRQKGSMLIGLIVTLVIMAALGAGMVYLTSTSTIQELFANNNARAYYAAESGGRYALAVIRNAYATNLTQLSTVNGSQTFTLANGDTFQIINFTQNLTNPQSVNFTSLGIANSGFLQAKRQINYKIVPANQSGVASSGGTTILNLSSLENLAGTSDKFKITMANYGTNGITVTPSGTPEEVVLVIPSGVTVTSSYSVQIKTDTDVANDWMMGFLFNINYNSVSATNGLPDGYGLTYFYAWTDTDQPVTGIMSSLPSTVINATSTPPPPLIVLWQSLTTSGTQTIRYLAYKILSTASLPGYLTTPNQVYFLGDKVGAPSLVVSVDRSSPTKNEIRAYYGSPTNSGLGTPDSIATDILRRGYNYWPANPTNTGTATSNIQWPQSTALWSSTYDYFTLIKWDGINTAVATFDGDGARAGAVVGNSNFTGSV